MATKKNNGMAPNKNNETKHLDNSILYFKMLRDADAESGIYKIELAKLLSDFDIFLMKLRILISIGGIVVPLFIILNNLNMVYEIRYLFPYSILALYFLLIIPIYSFKMYKRALSELKTLPYKVEE